MNKLTFESLDTDINPGVVLLSFHEKGIAFEYAGRVFYRLSGAVRLPRSDVVYGVQVGDTWTLSRNVRSLLDWCDQKGQAA